jgi:hypothetical protein
LTKKAGPNPEYFAKRARIAEAGKLFSVFA